jgi:hypothetical protein
MNGQYEVLNPWAEVDSVPLRGISPRLTDLEGKKIGFFLNHKRAAPLMMTVIERKLKERFPAAECSAFRFPWNREIVGTPYEAEFIEWLKGVDAVISSVGD